MRFTNEVNETQRSRYAVGKDRYKVPNYHIARHAELNQAIAFGRDVPKAIACALESLLTPLANGPKTKFALENNSAGGYLYSSDQFTTKGTKK